MDDSNKSGECRLSGSDPLTLKIRFYEVRDRAAVRALCLATADAGRPSVFADPELQMDLLTSYYTDVEPVSSWVAVENGIVRGYLTGCLNSRRFMEWTKWHAHPLTAVRMLTRNLFKRDMWRWVGARIKTLREGGAHREEWIKEYPAHLHLNLEEDFRGAGAGTALLKSFLSQCQAEKIPGVHLATRGDNGSAHKFFSKNGFTPLATINAYRPTPKGLVPVDVLIMVKKLPSSAPPNKFP